MGFPIKLIELNDKSNSSKLSNNKFILSLSNKSKKFSDNKLLDKLIFEILLFDEEQFSIKAAVVWSSILQDDKFISKIFVLFLILFKLIFKIFSQFFL